MTKKRMTGLLGILLLVLALVVGAVWYLCSRPKAETTLSAQTTETLQRLHVEDCRIADEQHNTVQLTGMSTHGILWYPQYANAGAMQTLKDYGANTIRLAVYADDAENGYVQKKEETLQLTYMAIENAISTGLYVIVDWHVLEDANPLKNEDSAIAFFDEIASHYGDLPNILYEICNEPNGDTTWDDIRAYAETVIPVIRQYAPNAIIIVGTPDYSHSFDQVLAQPLEADNILYSYHYYAGQHTDSYNDLFNRCEQAKLPVMVSEWGVNYGEDGSPALSEAKTFLTVLRRRKISWIAWSLSNKDEVFSAIRPDCTSYSGWTTDELTDVGKLIFGAFS